MKYIKIFEELKTPQLGDFVIGSLEENNYNGNKKFFFTNHIGKIVSIGKFDGPWKYEVVYDEDIPYNHVNGKPPISWFFKESEI